MIARLALALAALCWAGNFAIGRLIADDISPVLLNFLRWSIALLILFPFASSQLFSSIPLIKKRLGWFIVMSATGVVGYHILVYTALGQTTVTNIALIMGATPAAILIISSIMYGERHSKTRMLGVLTCFVGVAALVWGSFSGPGSGDVLACIAMPMWAYYTVSLRNLPDEFNAINLTVVVSFLGLLLMSPLLIVELINHPVSSTRFGTELFLALFYIGIIASGTAYVMWAKGISIIGSATGAAYMNLIPLFGVLIGVVFLKEIFTTRHAVAASLIVSGLLMSESQYFIGIRKHFFQSEQNKI